MLITLIEILFFHPIICCKYLYYFPWAYLLYMLMDYASLYANVSYNFHMLVYLGYWGHMDVLRMYLCLLSCSCVGRLCGRTDNVFMFAFLFMCGEIMLACLTFFSLSMRHVMWVCILACSYFPSSFIRCIV